MILLSLDTSHISIVLAIIINIILFLTIIKVGFKIFKNDNYFNRALSIAFGLLAYLSLLFQFGIIFFTYYLLNNCSNIVPEQEITKLLVNGKGDTSNILGVIKLILNYVFPNFFKYPTAPGIVVVIQFFLGKFTDLFILAYIVEKLKNRKLYKS